MKLAYSIFACLATLAHCDVASAFDSNAVLDHIRNAANATAPAAAPEFGGGAPNKSATARLDEEKAAAFQLLSTCEGRFGGLQRTLAKQVTRSETVSIFGGLIGAIGAIATCPHCAALASGLAGLANPLQQTFKDNNDTPQDTQDKLNKLSAKINDELDAYTKLPPAISTEPVADFERHLQARLDMLFVATASCQFYSTSIAAPK